MESEPTASPSLRWPDLRQEFARQPTLTRADLLAFFQRPNPDLKPAALNWRIHELLRRGLVVSAGRGRYALATAYPMSYCPAPGPLERAVGRILRKLQIAEYCLWSTAWVNEFSLHQAMRSFLVVEVPKDYQKAVFYALQDRYRHRVFLRPTPEVLTLYVAEANATLVVLPLISRAPVQQVDAISVPRLEKMLVDLFSRPDLFPAFQGHELKTVFINARRHYLLDERTLLRYAQRRHRADELREFLRQLPVQ